MSSNENKPWNDPRITAYALGEMPPDERAAFEQEMAADDGLAQAVTGAGQVTSQLSALFSDEATPPLTDGRRAAIINEPVIVRPQDEKTGRRSLIALLAIAATVLAAIGLAPLLQQQLQQVASVEQSSSNDHSAVEEVAVPAESDAMSVDAAQDVLVEEDKVWSSAEENAYRKSRMKSPLPWKIEAKPLQSKAKGKALSSSDAAVKNASIAASGDPTSPFQFIDRSTLEKNRNRLKSSQLLKTPPQSQAVPHLQNIPHSGRLFSTNQLSKQGQGLPQQAASQKKSKTEVWAAPISREQINAIPRPTLSVTPRIIIQDDEELALNGFGFANAQGQGPGMSGDRFDPIIENDFIRTVDHRLSTFSVDVDTASYSKVRDFLMRANQLPRPDAVRIEEMINYFEYADAPPTDDAEHPFAARVNITACPWNDGHRLARIAIKGKTMKPKERPACNLVFLLDTSGSMNAANKLPLVIEGMKMLTGQLTKNDKVAIVVYAGSAGLVLESTPAKKKKKIRRALENLSAGGSTNGGRGIELAYQTAREHFIEGGVNRVILCTDGDFNVGTTGTDSLVRMVEKEAKDDVYLTVLGFGMGNHNDAMLEQISGRGNGNYAFIDNQREAHRVLVKQAAGTLVTIAKDVKLQVDFNHAKVGAYRLIGYENRLLAKEDFNDDKKDAGEIGAGHSVTALYELVPPKLVDKVIKPAVDESKYAAKDKDVQPTPEPSDEDAVKESDSDESLTVRIRYKQPDADISTRVDFLATDDGQSFADSSIDTRFTAAVAGFGMLLRSSEHSGDWELGDALKVAKSAIGDDETELRSEFVKLVEKAKQLSGD